MKSMVKGLSRCPSDGKALSREVGRSHDGGICMEFGAKKQNHIKANNLFKCPFLINDIAVLLNCLFESFLNLGCNISNYITMSFVLHKLEIVNSYNFK